MQCATASRVAVRPRSDLHARQTHSHNAVRFGGSEPAVYYYCYFARMSLTCREEIGRVGRVGRGCYEDYREGVCNKSCVSGRVEFGDIERHATRTNGQHYTAADGGPTNHVSAWQADRGSRPTCRHPRPDPREDVGVSGVSARMSRGSSRETCFRGI